MVYIRTILRHRTGAKQRPRQSRRPSAAKSIIRAEVLKDTGSIYLQASFFGAATTQQGLYGLFAVLVGVAKVDVAARARVRVIVLRPCDGGRHQTSPLSARHIAGVTLAEKSGVECARGRYLWNFTLFTSPISRHPKSAYASQGL